MTEIKTYIREIALTIVLIILLVLCINPFDMWMPSSLEMIIISVFTIAFIIFSALVLAERPRDEREQLHIMFADRIAYLIGTGVLALAVVWQLIHHELDNILAITLGIMILAKTVGLSIARYRN